MDGKSTNLLRINSRYLSFQKNVFTWKESFLHYEHVKGPPFFSDDNALHYILKLSAFILRKTVLCSSWINVVLWKT